MIVLPSGGVPLHSGSQYELFLDGIRRPLDTKLRPDGSKARARDERNATTPCVKRKAPGLFASLSTCRVTVLANLRRRRFAARKEGLRSAPRTSFLAPLSRPASDTCVWRHRPPLHGETPSTPARSDFTMYAVCKLCLGSRSTSAVSRARAYVVFTDRSVRRRAELALRAIRARLARTRARAREAREARVVFLHAGGIRRARDAFAAVRVASGIRVSGVVCEERSTIGGRRAACPLLTSLARRTIAGARAGLAAPAGVLRRAEAELLHACLARVVAGRLRAAGRRERDQERESHECTASAMMAGVGAMGTTPGFGTFQETSFILVRPRRGASARLDADVAGFSAAGIARDESECAERGRVECVVFFIDQTLAALAKSRPTDVVRNTISTRAGSRRPPSHRAKAALQSQPPAQFPIRDTVRTADSRIARRFARRYHGEPYDLS